MKKSILDQNQKFPAIFFNRGIPNRLKFTNLRTSKTQETHRTRKEGAKERWTPPQYDRGLGSETSLETRVHTSCRWGTFCAYAATPMYQPWTIMWILTRGSNTSQERTKGKALDTGPGDKHWRSVVKSGVFTATFTKTDNVESKTTLPLGSCVHVVV